MFLSLLDSVQYDDRLDVNNEKMTEKFTCKIVYYCMNLSFKLVKKLRLMSGDTTLTFSY